MARVKTMSSSGNTVAVVEFYQWALLALQLQCLASSSDSLLTVPELQNMQIGSRSSAQSLEPHSMDAFTAAAGADFISSQTGNSIETLN
jgi:hypothetical protein